MEQKLIVWYGPDPGPGGRTVCKFYHIFKNTYSEVGPDVEQGQGWSSGEIPALAAASEGPFDTTTRGCAGADAGEPARDATGDVGVDPLLRKAKRGFIFPAFFPSRADKGS